MIDEIVKLKDKYRIRWHSDVFGPYRAESFNYQYNDLLTKRFIGVCNAIINHIALKGRIAEVEKMPVDNGVLITERNPNYGIAKLHWVWIEKVK